MAPPSEAIVEWQTSQIIKYLLADDDEIEERRSHDDMIEADGPGDDFDPVIIADKLRSVGDALSEDYRFKAAMTELKKAAAQEAAEAAFSCGVEALCQSQVAQKAEVSPEMQLIRASVAFGLYIKKSSPDLRNKVQSTMIAFLNRRVGTWVTQQGGWDKVKV
ncbi:hypothetical protein EXN66_Car005336 [Xyrichtys novacula]|uniref:Bcl-2-like protein 15 n=1 Tax=Xyrichtys novacula TaxID=13765 RepID=A0AAV1ESL8_XYRNO|nr:hypothetical protein EXN66_Car005336 [Xyrichtys novacula]